MSTNDPADKNTRAKLGSAVDAFNGKVNGTARIITNETNVDLDAITQLWSLRGAMLENGRYAEAKEVLIGVAENIKSGAIQSTTVRLYFVEALEQYSEKAGDRSFVREMMMSVAVPAVTAYNSKASANVQVLYNNAARILKEWGYSDTKNVIGDSDKVIAGLKASDIMLSTKDSMSLIEFMEDYPFMLASLSHTQNQLSREDATRLLKAMNNLYTRQGIKTSKNALGMSPALMGVFADVLIASMKAEGKSEVEIRKTVKSLIEPLLIRLAKEGGIAGKLTTYAPYNAVGSKMPVAATAAELTRLFNFGFDPKFYLNKSLPGIYRQGRLFS